MMSGMPLETCWAFNKFWNNKFYCKVASCWLFLLNYNTICYKIFANSDLKYHPFFANSDLKYHPFFPQSVYPTNIVTNRISCVHHQEDHLYTQLGTVCLSYIYVSSLAGGWICSILEFLPQPHWVLYTECTGCVDIFSLLICSEILKRFEDGSDVISIFDTFKLIGKYVEYTAK